jgi:hypothetical protein
LGCRTTDELKENTIRHEDGRLRKVCLPVLVWGYQTPDNHIQPGEQAVFIMLSIFVLPDPVGVFFGQLIALPCGHALFLFPVRSLFSRSCSASPLVAAALLSVLSHDCSGEEHA